jgi:hypothetical protein
MKENNINLTPTIKNKVEKDIGSKKFYFMSLTRSRLGGYHVDSNSGVLFKINGAKLSNNYSGKAVDYWNSGGTSVPGDHEMEDRLFTDKSSIDIMNYVEEVTVLVATEYGTHQNPYVLPIYKLAKQYGIPVYVYDNNKDWIGNNKKKALSFDTIKSFKGDTKGNPPSRYRRQSTITSLIELFYKKSEGELSKASKEALRSMKYDDFTRSVMIDIHNESGMNSNGSTENVKKLITVMKQNGYRKLENFIDDVKKKWEIIKKKEEKVRFLKTNRDRISILVDLLRGGNEIDLVPFGGDRDNVKMILRNLLFGLYRYDAMPDEAFEIYSELQNRELSSYELERYVNGIIRIIFKQVGMEEWY